MEHTQSLILIDAIALIYLESQIDHKQTSFNWIKSILDDFKQAKSDVITESGNINNVRNYIYAFEDKLEAGKLDTKYLLPELRTACGINTSMYDAIEMHLLQEYTEESRNQKIGYLRGQVKSNATFDKVLNEIQTDIFILKNGPRNLSLLKDTFYKIGNSANTFAQNLVEGKDPAVVSTWDFNNTSEDDADGIIANSLAIEDSGRAWKTGLQGLNLMFNGGFRSSKFLINLAKKNNAKSLINRMLIRHFCVYNTPILKDPTKNPTILVYTFEDPSSELVLYLFKNIWENQYGSYPKIDTASLTDGKIKEIRQYVVKELQKNGFNLIIKEVNPLKWNYAMLCHDVMKIKRQGCEVMVMSMDYLYKLPTTGIISGRSSIAGEDVRMLFENTRDAFCHDGTLVMTPHQLDGDAKRLDRTGVESFAKSVATKSYYIGSKSIDNAIDYSFVHNIVKFNNNLYMEIALDKYRDAGRTVPHKYHYCVYPFNPNGSILDDINGDIMASSVLGGGVIGSENENPAHALF